MKEGQNYGLRLQVLLGYLQQREAIGEPLSEVAQQRMTERLQGLLAGLDQTDPNMAKALRKQLMENNAQEDQGNMEAPAADGVAMA